MSADNISEVQSSGLKVLIEGFEVKVLSGTVSYGVNQTPEAQVSILPHDSLRRLMLLSLGGKLVRCKPKIHIFYYDNTTNHEHFKDRQKLSKYGDLKFWKLMFDGEITGMHMAKSSGSRVFSLRCAGHTGVLGTLPMTLSQDPMDATMTSGKEILTGVNTSISLVNANGAATLGAVFGEGWSTALELVQRMIAPIQGVDGDGFDSGSPEALTLVGNDGADVAPFKATGKKDTTVNGTSLENLNKNGAVAEYYRPYLEKNNTFMRFYQHPKLADMFYWADSTTQETLVNIPGFAKQLGHHIGQDPASYLELIIRALAALKYSLVPVSLPSYLGKEGKDLRSTLIVPDLKFAHPPVCNIIFPNMVTQLSMQSDADSTPTRTRLRYEFVSGPGDDRIASLLKNNYMSPPEVQKAFFEFKKTDSLVDNYFVTEEEKIRGVREFPTQPFPGVMSILVQNYIKSIEGIDPGTEIESEVTDQVRDILQSYTDFQHYTSKFQNSRGSSSGPFNPNVVPGFPALLLDTEESGYHQVGFVDAVSHDMSAESGTLITTIQLSNLRSIEEDIEMHSNVTDPDSPEASSLQKFLVTSLSKENLDTVYKDMLGCTSVDIRTTKSEAVKIKNSEGKEEMLWAMAIRDFQGNVLKGGDLKSTNASYLSPIFPTLGSSERRKHDSYSHALAFCKRPQISLLEYFEEYINIPNKDVKVTKKANSTGGVADTASEEPRIVVDSGSYFNPDIRDVVKMYADDTNASSIFRG